MAVSSQPPPGPAARPPAPALTFFSMLERKSFSTDSFSTRLSSSCSPLCVAVWKPPGRHGSQWGRMGPPQPRSQTPAPTIPAPRDGRDGEGISLPPKCAALRAPRAPQPAPGEPGEPPRPGDVTAASPCPRPLTCWRILETMGELCWSNTLERISSPASTLSTSLRGEGGRQRAAQRPSVRPSVPSTRRSPVQPLAGGDEGLVEVGQAAGPRLDGLQVQRVAALQVLVGDAGEAVGAAEGAG